LHGSRYAILLAVALLLVFPDPPPTSVEAVVGPDLVNTFRIQDGFACGGSAHDCMEEEEDAIVLARVAIGESPSSPGDQIYVMWLIKFRAYLGFKNAGHYSGWRDIPARWGPRTTIKQEALCYRGCQFSPARVATRIYYPCLLSETDSMRKMLCPTDADLPEFLFAYNAAKAILDAPIADFPQELRGYDNFRSPSITGPGQRNRLPDGLKSQQFFARANIWRDEFPDDNDFWANLGKPWPWPEGLGIPQ
jgi:hypothetical protein